MKFQPTLQVSYQPPPTSPRLFPLDLLKAASITAVVSFHALFVPRETFADQVLTLDLLFAPLKFCVPVLFTLSFFLLERSLARETSAPRKAKKRLIRLMLPLVFWFTVAAGLKLLHNNALLEVFQEVLRGGIFVGAYYLLVLGQYVPLFGWLRQKLHKDRALGLTLLAQGAVFGLIYGALALGSPLIGLLRALDRPLFIYWFGYLALGIFLERNWSRLVHLSTKTSWSTKALLVFLTALALVLELAGLRTLTKGEIPPFDYVLFSCLLSAGVGFGVVASVQEEDLPPWLRRVVSLLATYSLGIFCINGLLSQILLAVGSHLAVGWSFGLVAILGIKLVGWGSLLALSLGLAVLLDRLGLGVCVR
ncbi:acyltransferase family protein [Anthocerotibacter panamensis]|uniref:acyltransferase family protein n=1 Tax=Anthocerotibacter panamensis TaxID=2857077 RepID=UPI001C406935|nr:acyltransferase [Anthocerotibacter panamensis]